MVAKKWKIYAMTLWCANLLAAVLSYFFHQMFFMSIVMFLAGIPAYVKMIMTLRKKENMIDSVLNETPPVYMALAVVSCLYAFVSFLVCIVSLAKGGPHAENGMYFLQNHGSIVREITKAEYDALRLVEARLVSGFLFGFSALPMVVVSNRDTGKDS